MNTSKNELIGISSAMIYIILIIELKVKKALFYVAVSRATDLINN